METLADREHELGRIRLPVSGRVVALLHPSGADDLLLLEAPRTPSGDAAVAVELAVRLTRAIDEEPLDWDALPVTDLDALLLRLRQALFGDRIRADVTCPEVACRQRIDIDFSIAEFLEHHSPRAGGALARGWALRPAEAAGWFYLTKGPDALDSTSGESRDVEATSDSTGGPGSAPVRFRLPTAADLVAVAGQPVAARELARRCLEPPHIPGRLRRRVEGVMEAMAPSLSCDLQGACPECGATVTMLFDARWFCLRELRDRAMFVYQDVDLLARRYHWSETEILSMPQVRRAAYAEMARLGTGA